MSTTPTTVPIGIRVGIYLRKNDEIIMNISNFSCVNL